MNLLLSCYGLSAMYICTSQHLTLPAGPASLHRRTQSMSLYGHAAWDKCTAVESWFNSQQIRVDPPPLFLSRMLFIYGCKYIELDEQRHIPTTKGEEGKRNHTWGKRVLLFYIIITLSWVFSYVYCTVCTRTYVWVSMKREK